MSRVRASAACLLALAIGMWSAVPAVADDGGTPDVMHALDMLNVSCDANNPSAREHLPDIKTLLASAGRRSVALASQVAQNDAAATPAPAADQSVESPPPTPIPTPLLQRPPIGPSVITPPTAPPAPGAVSNPSPPPVPTPSPTPTLNTGPVPVNRPTGPAPTVAPAGGTPTPFPTATSAASPGPSPSIAPLAPGQILLLSDNYSGSTKEDQPQDFSGNVNLFYADGVIVADNAHYDGVRYMDFTGNAYIRNYSGDTVLRAEKIRFDKQTQRATLVRGFGETTQGVERGKLHFSTDEMVTQSTGQTVGTNANWTTCENPHGGYHMVSKTFEMRPGDKIIARKVTIFLGPLAIFYLPILIIGLRHDEGQRRTQFLPEMGYSQSEGFWVKTRIGFGNGNTYTGYYLVEYFSKLGLGLGYSAIIGTRNRRRQAQIDFYRAPPKSGGTDNLNITEQDQWSSRFHSQINTSYISSYGPLVVGQPPSLTIGGTLGYTGARTNDQFTFQRYSQGAEQGSINLGYTETYNFRSNVTEALNLGYTRNYNSLAGVGTAVGSTHFQSLTNYTTNWAMYSLNFDKTLSQTPSGKTIFPELQIQPRALFPNQRVAPVSAQFVLGEYTEPSIPFSTARGELALNFGPAVAHFWNSDFSASLRVRQDAYATGDLKAQIDQQASLTTPFGTHILNSVTYTETNSNGPQAEPFSTFDLLSGASHGAQDVLQIYNRDVYVLRLTDGTSFNRQGQPISYSLTVRPSYRSYVSLSGSYLPGPGQGFYTTQYQLITPLGYETSLQFAATSDWKNKGRLISKTIFLRKIIGECYDIRIAYNQDLKQVSVGFDLLAFPSYGVNFGLGQTGSIVPGNLTGSF